MKILETSKEYAIKGARAEYQDGANVLRWIPAKAGYFLIVVHQHHKNYSLEDIRDLLAKEYESDDKFLKGERKIYNEGKKLIVYCLSDEMFVRNRQTFKINQVDTDPESPYKIEIYACVTETGDDGQKVFCAYKADEKSDYEAFIPLVVPCVGQIKSKGLFKKTQYELLSFKAIPDDYNDGEFEYEVVGTQVKVPVSKEALSHVMNIQIPNEYKVRLNVSEDVKGIYKIEEK